MADVAGMNWTRKKIVLSAAGAVAGVAAAVGIGLALGGTPHPVAKAAPLQTPTPTPSPTRSAPGPLVSPFTGERVKSLRPVLAVKIDNIVYARPQTGLTSADIVYVLPVEGGLSRFLAIFSSHIPRVIGPVRSARADDLELLQQFGRPAFAWSGAQPRLTGVIEHDRRIVDLSADLFGGYYRNYNRVAPYNLFAQTRTLLAEAHGESKAHNIGFTFGPPNPGGRRTSSASVSYPAASFKFTWSAGRGRWLVWMDGARAASTEGPQLSAATVVIQHTLVRTSKYKEYGRPPPFASTVGHGTAIVLRNGMSYRVRWSRHGADGGTTFTTLSGQPMRFAVGPVWIVLTGNRRAERQ
jgi:Protein of unknown function (DUF3048) N-terminal domain/Protein of unknown function (DUF3048) C-terminal domain